MHDALKHPHAYDSSGKAPNKKIHLHCNQSSRLKSKPYFELLADHSSSKTSVTLKKNSARAFQVSEYALFTRIKVFSDLQQVTEHFPSQSHCPDSIELFISQRHSTSIHGLSYAFFHKCFHAGTPFYPVTPFIPLAITHGLQFLFWF